MCGWVVPVRSLEYIFPHGVVYFSHGLCQRAGRQPEVDGSSIFGLHVVESPLHNLPGAWCTYNKVAPRDVGSRLQMKDTHTLELIGEGGFKGEQAWLGEADERGVDGLVSAAFGGQSDAGWRGYQHETRILGGKRRV